MSTNFKKTLNHLLLVALLFVFGSSDLSATHIVGSDMSFKCLGNDFYEVSLTIRRDCFNGADDAPFDAPAVVGIFDRQGNPLNFLGRFGQILLPFEKADSIPNGLPGCAVFGAPICVEESRYTAVAFLPFREGGYFLAYQRCCRNVTLNNIVDPLETGTSKFMLLSETTLNECNSSPTFQDWPDVLICAERPVVFDHEAIDIDGDSLAYKLYVPHSGATEDNPKPSFIPGPPYDVIEYAPGFSLDNLMGGDALQIGSESGIITATPNIQGQFLIGVAVEEWRNGELLSIVRRDFEYNVRACEDIPFVSFDAPDYSCDGLTVSFDNTSESDYPFTWNFNFPDGDPSFQSSEVSPTFTFPTEGIYQVVLSSTNPENGCEITALREVGVFNSDIVADFDFNLGRCTDGTVDLQLISTANDPNPSFNIDDVRWQIVSDDQDVRTTGTNVSENLICNSEIVVTMNVTSSNGCPATITKTIEIEFVPPLVELLGDTIEVCDNDSTELLSVVQEGIVYSWSPLDGLSFSDQEFFSDAIANPDESTLYTVIATNGIESDTAQVLVIVNPSPTIDFNGNSFRICRNGGKELELEIPDGITITWDDVPGVNVEPPYSPSAPEFSAEEPTEFFFTISDGRCESRGSITGNPRGASVEQIEELIDLTTEVVCSPDGQTLNLSIENFDALTFTYRIVQANWVVSAGGQLFEHEGTSFSVDIPTSDSIFVELTMLDDTWCPVTITRELSGTVGAPTIQLVAEGAVDICVGESSPLIANPNSEFTYEWSPLSDLTFTSETDFSNPTVTPSVVGSTEYTVTVTNDVCSVVGTITVNALDMPVLNFGVDTVIACPEVGIQITSDNSDEFEYVWSPEEGLVFTEPYSRANPLFNPSVSTFYTVVASNGECSITEQVNVEVFETEREGIESTITVESEITGSADEQSVTVDLNLQELLDQFDIQSFEWTIISGTTVNNGTELPISGAIEASGLVTLTLIFTDSNGCTITLEYVLRDDDLSDVSLIFIEDDTITVCLGQSSDIIANPNSDFIYSWEPETNLEFTSEDDQSNPVVTPTELGTIVYGVTVTDGVERDSGMIAVTAIEEPSIEFTMNLDSVITCPGVEINNLVSAVGNPNDTYAWGPSEGLNLDAPNSASNPGFAPTQSTLYTVTVTNAGCSITKQIFVEVYETEREEIDAALIATETIDNDNITIDLNIEELQNQFDIQSFEWMVISGELMTTGTDLPIVAPIEATGPIIASFKFTDSNGCVLTIIREYRTDEPIEPTLIFIEDDTIFVCLGQSSDIIANPNSDWTYTWEPETNLVFASEDDKSSPIVTPTELGTIIYGVTVTDGVNSDSGMIAVTAIEEPSIAFAMNLDSLITCPGVEINNLVSSVGNPNDTYEWSPADGLNFDAPNSRSNPGFAPTQSTVYTVTVTNAGCSITEELFVEVYDTKETEIKDAIEIMDVFVDSDPPTLMLTFDESLLVDFDIVDYRWEVDIDGETISSTDNPFIVNGDSTQMITANLILTDGNGCEIVISKVISPNMDDNELMPIFEPINRCSGNLTTEVSVVTVPDGDIVDIIWDASDNITSNLTDNPVSIIALDGQDEIVLTYTALVDGESIPGTVAVPVLSDLVVEIDGDTETCTGEATFSATSNSSNTNFEWSLDPEFTDIIGTDSTITVQLGDDLTIYLRGSTETGCMSEVVSRTLERVGPVMNTVAPSRICVGDTAIITLEGLNGDAIEVIWDPSPNIISELISSTIMVVGLEGQDSLCLSYAATTLDGECTGEDLLCIPYGTDEPPVPTFDLNCTDLGAQFGVQEFFNDGDLLWDFGESDDDSDQSTLAAPNYVFSNPGTYTVIVSNNTGTCVFDPVILEVEIPEVLEITTMDSLSLERCANTDETITRTVITAGDDPIVWTDQLGNEIGDGPSVTFEPTGISSVTATVSNAQGCDMSITFVIDTYMFDIDITTPDPSACPGQPFEITAVNNAETDVSYQWEPAGAIQSGGDTPTPTVVLNEDTDLILTVTDNDRGCSDQITVPIQLGGLMVTAGADPDNEIFLGESVDIFAEDDGSNSTYQWNNGVNTATQTVSPTETTTYTVTVTDEFGCAGTAQVTITVIQPVCDETDIFIPSAFSPNGDGNNDVLLVRSNFIESMDLQVLSRWGQEVFRTQLEGNGWNGRFGGNGKELAPDSYAYCLQVTCTNGEEYIVTGHVTLLR